MYDSALLAHEAGIRNILVSAGYINDEPLRRLCTVLDAANIDLKSFSDAIYQKISHGHLQPVLNTLKVMKEAGVWLEVTNLLIPSVNDDPQMIRDMTESPILIKNYLPAMNKSEVFLVMVAGMGTIAGSVMGTYIGMLGGADPVSKVLFAKHLLSASLMAAPGSIVIAKLLCPQTEPVEDQLVAMEKTDQNPTVLDALAAGTMTGTRLMVNIAAMDHTR